MKRILAIMLTAVTFITIFAGCNKADETTGPKLKEGESLESIYTAIEEDFVATHGDQVPFMAMPTTLDDSLLTDLVGLNLENADTHYGVMAGMMPNFAEYISVKAKEGKAEEVAAELNQRKADLEAQYEQYNVMGNYDRAKNGEVYVKGDYVFMILIGAAGEDESAGTFADDVAAAKKVIDSKFE